jgi:hypothetical protein
MAHDRRNFLARAAAGASALVLSACKGPSETTWFPKVLDSAEGLTRRRSAPVRGPQNARAGIHQGRHFVVLQGERHAQSRHRRLQHGSREQFSRLADFRGRPGRASVEIVGGGIARNAVAHQITRHDCVEGWSCIGEWTGAPLKNILALAAPRANARYVVFYCADPMSSDPTDPQFYYESLDLIEACHPQTILAYDMNGAPLTVPHGAPVRLRCERQLGYKHAKYVQRLELVESFDHINGGNGGYWEDNGYTWWAGI